MVVTLGKFTLFPHQMDAVKMMANTPGLLLFYDMGSGKTITSIAVAESLLQRGEIEHVFVVMPKAIMKQYETTMKDAGVNAAKYTLWTHTSMLRVHDMDQLKNGLLIIDEAHKIRAEGAMFKKALALARRAPKRLLMTGTPIVNWPDDIAPLLALVKDARDVPAGTSESKFTTEFLQKFSMSSEGNTTWKWKKTASKDLVKYLRCTTLFYKPGAGQRIDYPSHDEEIVRVGMTDNQSRWHKALADKDASLAAIQAQFGEKFKKVADLLTYYTKYREIDSVYPSKWALQGAAPLEAPKYMRCVDMLKRLKAQGRKAVVYSAFLNGGIDIIKHLLVKQNTNIRFASIEGKNSAALNKKHQDDYNRNALDVLLLSQAGQTGLDLKNTSEVHIMEPDFNEMNIQQVIARSIRTGSHDGSVPKHVKIYRYVSTLPAKYQSLTSHPMTSSTADERLMEFSKRKEAVAKDFLKYVAGIGKLSLTHCATNNHSAAPWPSMQLNAAFVANNANNAAARSGGVVHYSQYMTAQEKRAAKKAKKSRTNRGGPNYSEMMMQQRQILHQLQQQQIQMQLQQQLQQQQPRQRSPNRVARPPTRTPTRSPNRSPNRGAASGSGLSMNNFKQFQEFMKYKKMMAQMAKKNT